MGEGLSRHTHRMFEISARAYSLAVADLIAAKDSANPDQTRIDMLNLTVAMLNASRAAAWEHYCETIDWYPQEWNQNNRDDSYALSEHVRQLRDSDGHPSLSRLGTAASIDASRYRQLATESARD